MNAVDQLSRAIALGALEAFAAPIEHDAKLQAATCHRDPGFRAWVLKSPAALEYGTDLARFARVVCTLPKGAQAWGCQVYGKAFAARWRELLAREAVGIETQAVSP